MEAVDRQQGEAAGLGGSEHEGADRRRRRSEDEEEAAAPVPPPTSGDSPRARTSGSPASATKAAPARWRPAFRPDRQEQRRTGREAEREDGRVDAHHEPAPPGGAAVLIQNSESTNRVPSAAENTKRKGNHQAKL